jgi:hypothetical protein
VASFETHSRSDRHLYFDGYDINLSETSLGNEICNIKFSEESVGTF